MDELADSVIDLGKSSSVPFDWDCSLYSLDHQGPPFTPDGGSVEGSGAGVAGIPPAEGGGVTSNRRSGAVPSSTTPVFRAEVGEFVALATDPHMKESVSVGKVLSLKSGEEGDELEVQWYIPVRVDPRAPRSKYGRGGWTPEFIVESGKLVPSVGLENVCSVSSKFLKLTAQGKLPSHVWGAVAESTLPAEEQEEEEKKEEENEEEETEPRSDTTEGGAGGSVSLHRQQSPTPLQSQASRGGGGGVLVGVAAYG